MGNIAKSILWQSVIIFAAITVPLYAQTVNSNQVNAKYSNPRSDEMEYLALNFEIDESKFQLFSSVAQYRRSSRLAPLPGFPENPNLDEAVVELGRDAGTMERLERGNLGARDYILTAWALIIARDPGDWGMEESRLTPSMRRNVAFVRLHRESLDALLRS
jgi:hypothetical protein